MKDFLDRLPKPLGFRWGCLLNQFPSNSKLAELKKLMPNDKKWHTLFEDANATYFDNVEIRKRTLESMT